MWGLPGGALAQSVFVQLDALVNAGSFSPDKPIAPGSIVSLFGKGLASGTFVASSIPLPAVLGSTRVTVNGVPAPLLFASPQQINLQFPYELGGDSASVTVSVGGIESVPLAVRVAAASPAIFTVMSNGTGPGAIVHPDGRLVSRIQPLEPGETVSLYATGLGAVSPAVESGAPAPGPPQLSAVLAPVRVLFDSQEGRVEFAGLAPGFAGLYQVNVKVPPALSIPYPAVTLDVNGAISNTVSAGGPGLLDVIPSSVPVGAAVALTVRGKNFSPGSVLEFGGQRLSGQVIPSDLEELRTTIPADLLSAPGRFPIILINSDQGNAVRSNPLDITITQPPRLGVSTAELLFTRNACSSAPATQAVTISNAGSGRLEWSATTGGEPWLTISTPRGTAPSTLAVTATAAVLGAGQYTGTVTIRAPSGSPREAKVKVTLAVDAAPPSPLPMFFPSVYVVDSLRRIGRDDPPPASGVRSAALFAARNEYEGFQVVVNGGVSGLTGVNAELTGALAGPHCAFIPAGMVAFYREHYVAVSSPSNLGLGGAKAGAYPDALIPFKNPFTGQPLRGASYPSAPFDVPAGQNQPVYAEVFIPPDTPAGVYTGSITMTREGGVRLADVPVTVTVWDFALSRAPSLHTGFQSFDSWRLLGPAAYYGYAVGSAEHLSVARAMDEHLIAHRLMPEQPLYASFDVDSSGHIVSNSETNSRLESLLARPEYSDFDVPFQETFPFPRPLDQDRTKAITYLRDAYEWLSGRGFLNKVWLRQFDEPQSAAEFQRARDFADLIHEANPGFRVAITGAFNQPEMETYLYGHLNIFIMGSWTFDPIASARRQALRDEIWSYTALAQNADNPCPFWQIDFPLLNYRIVPWINYRYGLTGLLYWTTAYWQELRARDRSPWADPCTLRSGHTCFNGDGMLVYPGKEVNYVIPPNAHGPASPAAVYGPISSLRLKALRDGMEDYELLVLAARRDRAAAQQIAVQVACAGNPNPGDATANCFHSWNRDPDSILQARAELARRIAAPR